MHFPTKLAVAMHEAGHAVVKLATPGSSPIFSMELRGNASEGTLGRVLTQTAWCPWLNLKDADGQPQPDATRGSDLHQVRVRLNTLYIGEEAAAFVRAWLETEALVARHMNAILWLGRLLFDCAELSGAEVHAC